MGHALKSKEGASIVESCIVMVLLCLILFGVIQVSVITAANDVLLYSATAGARCATIGYDDHMIEKVVRLAALPTLGGKRMSHGAELALVKNYLQYNTGQLPHITDEFWFSIDNPNVDYNGDKLDIELTQRFPMKYPFAKAFYNADYTELSTRNLTENLDLTDLVWENHADLYLQTQ